MKIEVSILFVLLSGMSSKLFAEGGYATDGFDFILIIAGVLFFIAILLTATDWLQRNWKAMIFRVLSFLKRKIDLFRGTPNKILTDPTT